MTNDPIAIIGMSARAAGVETLAELWDMLRRGRRRFAPVPEDRWHGLEPGVELPNPPTASLLERIDTFDARFFGIAPRMAAWMDPQHRMMLELAWHAVENAGLDPDRLDGAPIGVFVGTFLSDYRERINASGLADGAAFPGGMTAFSANRVSYQFGWTGPSMVIDSACSSSLSALGIAVQGLQRDEYPMALVGTASVISNGFYANTAYRGGALSPTGDSVPFGPDRDGYVRGEGGACVLLKRLDQALADGDPVHAVIRAVGTAHNGRGGGLTGTDVESQVRLLTRTAAAAGCSVGELGYLEAHGSGTPSGDAVEVAALARALADSGGNAGAGPGGKVWVGSIKASIGHLEAAAGLMGVVKTALVLRHGRIPRIAGLTEADPRLPIEGTNVAIAVDDVPWPAGAEPRLAGINSFGLGGAVSHVLLEEPTTPAQQRDPAAGPHLFPLSGQDEDCLAKFASNLLAELDAPTAPGLPSLAWTLQTNRRDHQARAVITAAEPGELRDALSEVASGKPAGLPESTLAQAWLRGEAVDWASRWGGDRPPRSHLPGSPLRRRSHWYDRTPPAPVTW
ncbi:beta-ketoacyl synthase N-terminal-like domain-containing protein [Saccharopolyspora sp. NPDC050389]|uniref:polyketide synthase n=1 Tax=Saccharopolyspora sp. NPDC050389 TaxID=3155516 RepID=UPI0033CF9803